MPKSSGISTIFYNYLNSLSEHAKIVSSLDIESLVIELLNTKEKDAKVFLAGNGGSASTANHFATDLGVGSKIRNAGIRAFSLSANNAVLSALANDVNYSEVFSLQLELLSSCEDDLLIVFSASGNSANIIKVLETAKRIGIKSCAFTGFDGGEAKKLCDISIHVDTEKGKYGIVEDLHLAICHAVTEIIRVVN